MTNLLKAPRSDNRLQLVLDVAARLFREKGYHAASMRDIAAAVGMLPGSIYYHFPAKDDLLVAVYAEGVRMISDSVKAAAASAKAPWKKLEAACIAHTEALLATNDYAQVVIRVLPNDVPAIRAKLVALRDAYDRVFDELIAALPLKRGVDRHYLRLALLGALNWSQNWFRPGGDTPRSIALRFLSLLRYSLE